MRLIRVLVLVVFGIMLAAGMLVEAQDVPPSVPLLAIVKGTVLQQTDAAAMAPYMQCQPPEGIIAPPLLSPDGTKFIMETQPDVVRRAILDGAGIGGGPLPANYFMCDRSTNVLYKVADQPASASFMNGDIANQVTVRSDPAWSPDSSAVAWTEQSSGNIGYNLMIFDLAQLLVFQIPLAALPDPAGEGAPFPVMWGQAGILVDVISLDENTFNVTEAIYTFDKQGNYQTGAIIFTGGENADVINERLLVTYQDKEYLGLLYTAKGWVLVDPRTGAEQPMPGVPELYSPTAPDGFSLLVAVDASLNDNWQVTDFVDTNGQPQQFLGYPKQRIGISPDGKMIAFATSLISLWQNGTVTPVAGSDGFGEDFRAGLVWGPTAWRVAEGATFIPPAPLTAPGT